MSSTASHATFSAYTDAMRASRAELVALLSFLRHRPRTVTVPAISSALIEFGDIDEALGSLQPNATLFGAGSSDIEEVVAAWTSAGILITTILDDDYPRALRDIHEAPPVIFTRGELKPVDRGVSVVGSRKATEHGLQIADSVARALVRDKFTVIAGLAAGIDTQAHKAALDESGRTVAVIGTGILNAYPATNRELHAEIADRGLLLSQFWPDAPPRAQHFPIRNATMSGLGIATFIAEAGETSGARIQARLAVQHGRPVILSDHVYRNNAWAKELEGRPRVWIAENVDEVVAIVNKLDATPTTIDELLDEVQRELASQ